MDFDRFRLAIDPFVNLEVPVLHYLCVDLPVVDWRGFLKRVGPFLRQLGPQLLSKAKKTPSIESLIKAFVFFVRYKVCLLEFLPVLLLLDLIPGVLNIFLE